MSGVEDRESYINLPVVDQMAAASGWLKESLDYDQSFCRLNGAARERLRDMQQDIFEWAKAVQDVHNKYEDALIDLRRYAFWRVVVDTFRRRLP